jgi:hypothetical protein
MNIKGGRETSFQVDTGATCSVIKRNELVGTKYMKKMKKTKQVLKNQDVYFFHFETNWTMHGAVTES